MTRGVCELSGEVTRATTTSPAAIRMLGIAWAAMIALSIAVSFLEYRAGFSSTRWFPLCDPFLGDFMEYPGTYRLLHTSAFFFNTPNGLPPTMFSAVAYPPFAAVLLAPVYLFGNPLANFVLLAVAAIAAAMWLVRCMLRDAGMSEGATGLLLFGLTAGSFPFLRLLHQGNVELILCIFTATGLVAFIRGRDHWAAVLFGTAAAMKLYPLALLLLFIPRRSYKALALSISAFATATLLSLLWLGPTLSIAWHGSLRNVFGYQSLRAQEWTLNELVANHSIFELLKLGALMGRHSLVGLTVPYYACCAAVVLFLFFKRVAKLALANQVLFVSIVMVSVPTVSYYHTLVHLYAPLLMLVLLALRRSHARGLTLTMLLFLPLFAPYTLLTFPGAFLFCGLVQAVTLLALSLCSIEFDFAAHVESTEVQLSVSPLERSWTAI